MDSKQRVFKILKRGGVFYTWYRFDQKSNYIDFETWCKEEAERMKEDFRQDFIQRNEASND